MFIPMVMLDNLSLATMITQSDVESDGDEPQVLQVVPAPPVRSGEGDDEVEPSLKRHHCMLMSEVVGDDGIFEIHNASKTERWVEITERLGSALNKDLSADGVRKH
ncbi:hypothetical protein GN244_ATG00973 [Phytophthora infestans]|uniref:Uncharacterized protein n=1 Tax=Phytophthora infestans TaxID=4787 RepID=A0A833TBI0_PHYIN|nr:hypothetical protein GN244_ATG00973 [Phytophthora infestans]